MRLLDIGQPKRRNAGCRRRHWPVGAAVGQIGEAEGLPGRGIAGGAEKCRHATGVLGFDLCALIIALIISHNSLLGRARGYRYLLAKMSAVSL